jgi:hypothetical protein
LSHPSAPQAPSFAFASIFQLQNQILQIPIFQTPNLQIPTLQTPNLQLLRIKLHYGTPVLAMLQPPAYHILPESQPYQIASEQPYLAPIQTQASANLALKGSRNGYRTLRQRGDPYLRWTSFTLTPAMYLFPPSRDTRPLSPLPTKVI